MKRIILIIAAAILALAVYSCTLKGPAGPSGANTVTAEFQYGVLPGEGYTQAYDADIDNTNPIYSSGGEATAYLGYSAGSGKQRTLLRFDVSSIAPSRVTVTSAYLVVYVNNAAGTSNISVYSASRSWTEGTQVYGPMSAGLNTSWLNYNGTGFTWTAAGGDYNNTAISNAVAITALGQFYTFTLDAPAVKSWITSPAANYGIVLIDSVESGADHWAAIITKDDAVNTDKRPRLIVNYTLN